MKKIYFFAAIAAMAGVAFTSCSQDESVDVPFSSSLSNQIKFSAVQNLPGHAYTRGTAITGLNWMEEVTDMQVWGFYSADVEADATKGIAPGAQYVGSGANGIFIDYAASSWGYRNTSDVAFWPKANLNFQAVIPSADDTEITNFTFTPDNTNKTNYLTASVTIPTTVGNQRDIMFAQAIGEEPRTADSNTPVTFEFNHALAQVVFSGKLASENLSATVEDIRICNIDQKGIVGFKALTTPDTEGTAQLMTRADVTNVTRNYARYSVGLINTPTLSGATDVDAAKNLTAVDGALMMLPVDRSTDKWTTTPAVAVPITTADAGHMVYLAISCKVLNGSTYLIGSTTEYETVYIPFEADWIQGKKYTYTLVFGTGSGGYDEDGVPLDNMLPIEYSLDDVIDWSVEEGEDIEF